MMYNVQQSLENRGGGFFSCPRREKGNVCRRGGQRKICPRRRKEHLYFPWGWKFVPLVVGVSVVEGRKENVCASVGGEGYNIVL